ncbi:MAG: hypothetical protein OXP09_07600 [Gammaproteobacteria bacterium]|nr:hypothetical protein [Gammaproteobacteria bacterium]MDE0365423.1 hypothetical protein [Gammaproteobacteria bacterium]
MLRSIVAVVKTLYRVLPRGLKQSLRQLFWKVVMRNPDSRRLIMRLSTRMPTAAEIAAGQAPDPVARDIFRAHGAHGQHHWDTVVDLLTPLVEAEQLGTDDYAILIASLLAQGRLAECRRPFAKACARARQSKSATVQAQVAELAIKLDDKDAALEFSARSGSAWLAQYVAVFYGGDVPVVHEALRDRLPAGTGTAGAVTLALLDYGWPAERAVERNLGDYLQTLAVMRHVARFHAPGAIRCDAGLDQLFAQLSRSWRPEERMRLDRPLDVAVVDRDCARWQGEAWLPIFGWFGYQREGRVQMTFPLQAGLLPIFFSFHLNDVSLLTPALCDFLKHYEPIGCRDRTTRDRLASTGVKAFFSGCITSTLALAEDDGPSARGARYQVDDAADPIPGATELTHELDPAQRPFTEWILESLDRLVLYQQAASVSTSRLHCYLPCRALGTPVTFNAKNPADIRFDGLVDLDKDELRGMAAGLTGLMETVFRQILAGADRETVYRHWREATLPLVERDESERRGYTKLFARRPSRGREDARPTDPIPVALTFDRNLVDYVPNLIRSVEAHASRKISYHLLVRGLSSADRDNLQRACRDVAIEWHPMDAAFAETDDRGLLHYITVSTMDRCLLPEVLPDVDKVLYLDTDMVVLGDVAELYATPLGDSTLGAVPKHYLGSWLEWSTAPDNQRERVEQMRQLRAAASVAGPLNGRAFNAGVLLMSLQAMREDGFASQVQRNFHAFGYDDQTQLNLYAGGDYVQLPVAWNVDYRDYFFGADGKQAKIVHWNGADKPWQRDANDAVLRTRGLWERYSAPQSGTASLK